MSFLDTITVILSVAKDLMGFFAFVALSATSAQNDKLMKSHTSYLEIFAPDHRRFGLALGWRLKEEVQRDVKRLKKKKNYTQLRWRSRSYLEQASHFAPNLLDELRGYAEGAGVLFEDVWLLSLEDEMDQADHCTTVVTNGGRLLAHNEDWDVPGFADRLYLLRRRIGRKETLDLYYRNTLGGNAISVNSHGLVQAVNSLWCRDQRVGVPRNVVARLASEARSAREAIKIIKKARRASGYAHILLDHHRATIVESTAIGLSVTRPSFPYCHTNHILDPKLLRLQTPGHYPGSNARLSVAKKFVKEKMLLPALDRALADTRHGPVKSLLNKHTIARVLVDRDRKTFRVWLKREAKKGWVEYQFKRKN
jgi:predicted choloylglycine hydrolase